MTINNLSVILNDIKAIVASHADILWQFQSHVIEWQFQWNEELSVNTLRAEFLSCMAFSVFINQVVYMASLLCGYFVYAPGET